MKRRYGESKVRVLQENTVYSGSLGEWKAGRIETCTFNIWLHRTEKINTKRLFKNIREYQRYLTEASEEDLAFLWRVRNDIQLEHDFKSRTMLWDELESRYEGLTRIPITLRFPFFDQFK